MLRLGRSLSHIAMTRRDDKSIRSDHYENADVLFVTSFFSPGCCCLYLFFPFSFEFFFFVRLGGGGGRKGSHPFTQMW